MFGMKSSAFRRHRVGCWTLLFLLLVACREPTTRRHAATAQTEADGSREQLLAGDVEKKWVYRPEQINAGQRPDDTTYGYDVRFIFYRNYNLTTFGANGSRQGHWSLDDDGLSFHFEPPDSIRRFDVLELESNVLRVRNEAGDVHGYRPE